MTFIPNIENRKAYYRKCKCGKDHENKYVRGLFKYGKNKEAIFCAALLEHQESKHIWISFIVGNWPGTAHENCAVTCHIQVNEKGQGSPSDLAIHFGTSESTKMPAIFDGHLSPDRPASVSLRHFPLVSADFVALPQMTRRDYTPALFPLSASHNG